MTIDFFNTDKKYIFISAVFLGFFGTKYNAYVDRCWIVLRLTQDLNALTWAVTHADVGQYPKEQDRCKQPEKLHIQSEHHEE